MAKVFVFAMREQLWEIVLGALFTDAVRWCDEHVGQKTWLDRRDVSKPATHAG